MCLILILSGCKDLRYNLYAQCCQAAVCAGDHFSYNFYAREVIVMVTENGYLLKMRNTLQVVFLGVFQDQFSIFYRILSIAGSLLAVYHLNA